MAKALGIGGVFFKARDPKHLATWYETWLGLEIDPSFGGTSFYPSNLPDNAYTVWSPFKESTTYFDPSTNPFMINLIVDDLSGFVEGSSLAPNTIGAASALSVEHGIGPAILNCRINC